LDYSRLKVQLNVEDCCGFSASDSAIKGELPVAFKAGSPGSEGTVGSDGFGACTDPAPYYAAMPPPETSGTVMQQSMIRVRDPSVSVPFYRDVLGMTLVQQLDFPQWGFSLSFMAYLPQGVVMPAEGSPERMAFLWSLPATVELTHNHGSESKPAELYHTGNSYDGCEGGFGHLGITVPDVYEACERFKKLGVEFKKSPNSGGMKGLAFIKDPDGYWIEILHQGPAANKRRVEVDCCGVNIEGGGGYTGGGGGVKTS
jgi:lactoylglutathione lyase